MASAVRMPQFGNTATSALLLAWRKAVGERVTTGEVLVEIETDKATLEVESPAEGLLLAQFYEAGAEVATMAAIGVIGAAGEDIEALRPTSATAPQPPAPEAQVSQPPAPTGGSRPASSPRARKLAAARGLSLAALRGSGPGGRIIERDVQVATARRPRLTPVARAMLQQGGYRAPPQGSGPGGRIRRSDLIPAPPPAATQRIPLRGARRVTARRMLASLQTTAQLTLHAPADARALLALRRRLKSGAAGPDLSAVTLSDLLHFAVARTLPAHPALNARLEAPGPAQQEAHILQYHHVHLGFAVDSPRGLFAPVIHHAGRLDLAQLAGEARRLARACHEGTLRPEELEGATFTVSNLGAYGIESFTPILNPPQAGILGVGAIHLKAVEREGGVAFLPHISLSLTIDHQVLDGAPAARFLQALAQYLARIDRNDDIWPAAGRRHDQTHPD